MQVKDLANSQLPNGFLHNYCMPCLIFYLFPKKNRWASTYQKAFLPCSAGRGKAGKELDERFLWVYVMPVKTPNCRDEGDSRIMWQLNESVRLQGFMFLSTTTLPTYKAPGRGVAVTEYTHTNAQTHSCQPSKTMTHKLLFSALFF